jgi:hypothetical protein
MVDPPGEKYGAGLVCAECGGKSEAGASGWRAYLRDDDQAVVFCPACAKREFGGDLQNLP